MAKFIISLFILAVVKAVSSEWCYSSTYKSGTSCTWGCCYSYIYPCCDPPYYATATFIAPVAIACGVVISIIIICLRWYHIGRRVPRAVPMATVPQAAQPQIAYTQYGGYSNYPTAPPPPYATHQTNRLDETMGWANPGLWACSYTFLV